MSWQSELFDRNEKWAESIEEQDKAFFTNLATGQSPSCLWISCCDSRVSANRLLDLLPGHIFTHRNVGNLVTDRDSNCMSALQYAVEALKVEHIVVCGHYGCGGVGAAMNPESVDGALEAWLDPVIELHRRHKEELDAIEDEDARFRRFCEINMQQQVLNLSWTPIVQHAWKEGRELTLHGWMYDLVTGRLSDTGLQIEKPASMTDS